MAEPIDIVRDFCAACEGGDIDAILDFFADDAVYHNMPVAAVQGKDAIRATFDMFMTGVDKIEFRVLNISAAGSTVLTERVDVFVLPTGTIELPVMCSPRKRETITWRDYFDLNQYLQQLPQQ